MISGSPPLSTEQTVAILRHRYPDGLVCTACGALLATRRESYQLIEASRQAYVCAECRVGARLAAGLTQLRRDVALVNLTKARALAGQELIERVLLRVSPEPIETPLPNSNRDARLAGGFSVTVQWPPRKALVDAQRRLGKPGRPRVPVAEQQRRARERARAYRSCRKARWLPASVSASP
jgi:hypothetical protein